MLGTLLRADVRKVIYRPRAFKKIEILGSKQVYHWEDEVKEGNTVERTLDLDSESLGFDPSVSSDWPYVTMGYLPLGDPYTLLRKVDKMPGTS